MTTPLSGSDIANTTLTQNVAANALLNGFHWLDSNISYSFLSANSVFDPSYSEPTFLTSIRSFTNTQQLATMSALNAWANVANLNFTLVPDNASSAGVIRLGFSTSFHWGNYVGDTFFPSFTPAGGDVWLDPYASDALNGVVTGQFGASSFQNGTYADYTLLHELGHALGLKHPFEASTDGGGQSLGGTAYSAYDSRLYTVMSYTTDQSHPDATYFTFNPTTPMLLDIAAIQAEYGVNSVYNAGNTTYSFNDNVGQYYFQTIWDGGGSNTIAYSGTHAVAINLNAGTGSQIGNPVYEGTASNTHAYQVNNVWIAYGTNIQTLDLSNCHASYSVNANDLGDRILAGIGSGTIVGGSGNDTIVTNLGNEVISCGAGIDTVTFSRALATYAVSYSNGVYSISSVDGIDSVSAAEYLSFSDQTELACAALSNLTNSINLGNGNTAAHTSAANDLIVGGAGIHTVIYDGKLSAYSIDVSAADNAVVADSQSSRNGTDSVLNIQRLQFTDTNVALDTGSNQAAGGAYMLYQATFNRTPDAAGLGYWIAQLDNGKDIINDVANYFVNSPEFMAKYGANSSNASYVDNLYQNVLHRAGEAGGVAFWNQQLNDHLMSRAALLELFATLPEGAGLVGSAIAHGINYTPYTA